MHNNLFFHLRRILWITLLISNGSQCFADILTLNNGDRLSGKIKKLTQKKIMLKTAYADVIQIKWEKVAEVTTQTEFQVEVETGRRYSGRLRTVGGELEVVDQAQTSRLPLSSVVGITPGMAGEESSIWRQMEGQLDLGYNLARGNSRLNQSSLAAEAELRRDSYRIGGNLSSALSRQDDLTAASRQAGRLRLDWFVSPRVFRFALAEAERNDSQRLKFRSNWGGGLGRTLLKRKNSELSLLGGVTFKTEKFQSDATQPAVPPPLSGEALAGLEWKATLNSKVQLVSKLSVYPSIVEGGQYRFDYSNTFRLPLIGRLNWSVGLFDRYVSDPPLDLQRNDLGLVSSVGLAF